LTQKNWGFSYNNTFWGEDDCRATFLGGAKPSRTRNISAGSERLPKGTPFGRSKRPVLALPQRPKGVLSLPKDKAKTELARYGSPTGRCH